MRALTVVLLVMMCALPLLAAERAVEVMASGCVTTFLSGCDVTERGELAPGDCTFSDGTKFDRYQVVLPGGREVSITLRPLDPTFTSPQLIVSPPAVNVSTAPAVERGPAVTVWVKTLVTTTWTFGVATRDAAAAGRYAVHVDCLPGQSPLSMDCVAQELLCGNEAIARLTDQSCRFTSAPRVYTEWMIWGVEGDRLNIVMQSLEFQPIFSIYNESDLIRTASTPNLGEARMDFRVPRTGWYFIVTSSRRDFERGQYFLNVNCSGSGCLFPYITEPLPPRITGKLGERVTIPFNVSFISPFTASLFGSDVTPVATSNTNSIATPPVTTAPQRYFIRVENECGWTDTDPFTVAVEPSRRRAVRK